MQIEIEDPVEVAGRGVQIARGALIAALAVWTWQFARAPMASAIDSLLHLPNLVFHEAGHVIFAPFGQFMTVAGGSLTQVAIPVALGVALLRQGDRFGAAICGWWVGQNFVDLAPYIADARALQMVLLGGRTGAEVEGHDWEYLLTALGWMQHDVALGLTAYRLGLAVMLAALAWAALGIKRPRQVGQPFMG